MEVRLSQKYKTTFNVKQNDYWKKKGQRFDRKGNDYTESE